jgi:hypothetical protein
MLKKSSPIYFADNLQGDLICFRNGDDNEYKDIVRLSSVRKEKKICAGFSVEAVLKNILGSMKPNLKFI